MCRLLHDVISNIQRWKPLLLNVLSYQMQIWELVILFCVFMIDPPRCSTSIIQQVTKRKRFKTVIY